MLAMWYYELMISNALDRSKSGREVTSFYLLRLLDRHIIVKAVTMLIFFLQLGWSHFYNLNIWRVG